MKKLILLLILIGFSSCQIEGELTHDKVDKSIEATSILKYSGTFTGTSGINVNGQVKIYLEGTHYRLQLEDFSISSGPDLKVYLSKSASPNEFVNLGNLTSNTIYSIPAEVNVNAYSHVLIHCQQYNHLFAIAALTPIN
jgi:Electron transfer DM13